MKIELRNLTVNLKFSEETTQFMADVFVDGIKVAYAKNEGYGGPTNYNAYQGQYEALRAAENYCESLPPIVIPMGDKPFEINSTLEHVIDGLVETYLAAKESEKFKKKLKKDMLKGIVSGTGKEGQYTLTSWKGKTIAQVLATPQGKASVKQQIVKLKSEGRIILNENIPADLL